MSFSAVNVATTVGLVGSAWVSGGMNALTTLAIPAILTGPNMSTQTLATQWRYVYVEGMALLPRAALVTMLGYAYLAYDRYTKGLDWRGLATAAVLTIGVVPFTMIFLLPINSTLMGVAAGGATTLSHDEVRQLVGKWGSLNFWRSLLPLSGALVGVYNLLW